MQVTERLLHPAGMKDPRLGGALLSVATGDVFRLAATMQLGLYPVGEIAAILASAVILLTISWPLGLAVLIGGPLMLWLMTSAGRPLQRRRTGGCRRSDPVPRQPPPDDASGERRRHLGHGGRVGRTRAGSSTRTCRARGRFRSDGPGTVIPGRSGHARRCRRPDCHPPASSWVCAPAGNQDATWSHSCRTVVPPAAPGRLS